MPLRLVDVPFVYFFFLLAAHFYSLPTAKKLLIRFPLVITKLFFIGFSDGSSDISPSILFFLKKCFVEKLNKELVSNATTYTRASSLITHHVSERNFVPSCFHHI